MKQSLQNAFEPLLLGMDLDEPQENLLLAELNGHPAATVLRLLLNERRGMRAAITEANGAVAALTAQLARIGDPPLSPADVLRVRDDSRLEVLCQGRRHLLSAGPELDCSDLGTGDEVWVNREMTTAIARNPHATPTGTVAVVRDVLRDDLVALRTPGDEELIAWTAPALAGSLESGDRVLLRRDAMCVLRKLPGRSSSPFRIEEAPADTFDAIGGLDDVIAEIRTTLDLATVHRDIADAFHLDPPSGMILVGPPGVGKTMVARAMANYLSKAGTPASFLHVKPGELRSKFYGESEERVRELFAYARSLPGLVILFMDEIDSVGTREQSPNERLDGHVIGSLLVELDGLDNRQRCFVIAATNRLDLCDDALVRCGRIGTVVTHITRPGREAARQILRKHFEADVPCGDERGHGGAGEIVEAAVGYLFSDTHGPRALATAVLADASRHDILPRHVVSGALLKAVVDRSKRTAATRRLRHRTGGGVLIEDMLEAIDAALTAETAKLKSPASARRLLDFDQADQIVRVETPRLRPVARHRFVTAA